MKQENIKNKLNGIMSHPTDFENLPGYFNNGEDVLEINIGNITNGGTLKFYQDDSSIWYEENLKTQPKDWHYRTKDITYDLNSYGYRTKEFDKIDWKNSIVVFGCSNVFGVGLAEDETITYHLSKLFNKNVVNMGIAASSNELMLYNSLMLKLKYGQPFGVIMLWSSFERFSYFIEHSIVHIGAWNFKDKNSNKNFNDHIYENSQYSWVNSPIKTYYTIACSKEIWSKNTLYYDCSFFGETSEYGKIDFLPYNIDSKARDLSHPSSEIMRKNAEFIYNKMIRKTYE